MIPHFNICLQAENKITITDLTKEADEYVPENSDVIRNYSFKYSETITINIILLITVNETLLVDVLYTDHCVDLDEVHYLVMKDGYYLITHIILPTKLWLESRESVSNYDAVYIADDNKVYQYIDETLIECSPLDLMNTTNTTISSSTKEMFFTFNLKKCYINIAKKLLNEQIQFKCAKVDSNEVFKRDFLWMTLNVIRYYLKLNQLYEAEKILEEVNYCNGLCKEVTTNTTCNCGGKNN